AFATVRPSRPVLFAGLILLAAAPFVASRPTAPVPGGPAGPPRLDFNGDPLPVGAMARVGTVRFRHESGVYLIEFSPDGRVVYSVCHSPNTFVRAWSVADGRELRRFGGEFMIGSVA